MRVILVASTVVLSLIAVAQPALAQGQSTKPKAEVVERDARGKAIKVKIGDTVYDVCREGKYDSCINPREAGLAFGNVPLDTWPKSRSNPQN
ncbi:hypothetical protein KK137_03710 [Croceibacterium sp. LX-88]|jgi:hypothetical protein|uniref:Uncharacterized protein n=1 Tax=Croceibacterium selenioxidans TaxID=2838833 RepID=A0ABS5W0Z3_9SPHN|nr:hypothetical protein [Croceibacterium selenioxidans]MBT2133433.1 hypothetical protein [Croceibacterium selenioxidans]